MRLNGYLYAFVIAAVAIAAPALAGDINFGSTARSVGLGGAGLALAGDLASTAVTNPAATALREVDFKFIPPGLDFHTNGASFAKLLDNVNTIVSGGNSAAAMNMVNSFGKNPTTMTVTSQIGFAGRLGVVLEGEANATIATDSAAREWAQLSLPFQKGFYDLTRLQGSTTNINLINAIAYTLDPSKGDALTALNSYLSDLSANAVQMNLAYSMPTINYSSRTETPKGTLWVGGNLKILRTESHSYQIQARPASATPIAQVGSGVLADLDFAAVEMPVQKRTSLKADVGAIFQPHDSVWKCGVVVSNFIKPKMRGIEVNQADPMVSIGVGSHPLEGMTIAADIVNITGSNDEKPQLRFGFEWRLADRLLARVGYSGKNLTYGLDIYNFNLAFAANTPRLLTNVLRF